MEVPKWEGERRRNRSTYYLLNLVHAWLAFTLVIVERIWALAAVCGYHCVPWGGERRMRRALVLLLAFGDLVRRA